MATRRTTIEIDIQGLAQLQATNTALGAHERRVQAVAAAYLALNAATGTAGQGVGQLGRQFVTVNQTFQTTNNLTRNVTTNVQNMGNAASGAGRQFGGMLTTMLQYRGVGLVFAAVQSQISQSIEAIKDLEKQTARVQRLSPAGSSPLIRSTIAEEVARTGGSIEQIGEALYQLAPFIKGVDAQFSALKSTMNLVIGTESDARDTARALAQAYNQFGDQLDQTASKQENLRRLGELFAIAFKTTNTEVSEVSQSLKYFGSIASAAKIPIEQVFALIGALDKAGIRSTSAGTALRSSVGNIISKYQPTLPDGGSGIIYKKQAYHFDAPLTPQGGLYPVKMFKSIAEQIDRIRHDGLPNAEYRAMQFWKAVSGRENSTTVTAVMTNIKDLIKDMTANMEEYKKALHGGTREAEKLKEDMTTTAVAFEKVWKGTFDAIAAAVDVSPLRGFLQGVSRDIAAAADALRLLRASQIGSETSDHALFTGTGPASVARTYSTVQEALRRARNDENARNWYNNAPSLKFGKDDVPRFMTDGMTDEQKAMLRRRYFNNGPPQNWHDIIMSMERDSRIMEGQLRNPFVGPLRPAEISGGLSIRGVDGKNKHLPPVGPAKDDDQASKDAAQAAKDAADRRLEQAKSMVEAAKNKLDWMKSPVRPGGPLAPDDPAVIKQSKDIDRLQEMVIRNLADVNDRNNQLYSLTHGGGAAAKNAEEILKLNEKRAEDLKQAHEEAAKEHAATTEYYAENARGKYGLFSRQAQQRAEEAQKAAEATATGVDLLKLREGATGPRKELKDAQREAITAGVESVKTATEGISQYASEFVEQLIAPLAERIHGRERGLRPNRFGGTPDSEQEAFLTSNISDIQKTLDLVTKQAPDASERLAELKSKLADAVAALVDFKDSVEARSYERRVQTEADAYQLRDQEINHLHRLKFNKDEESATADGMRKYQELIVSAQKHLEDVKNDGGGVSERHSEAIRKAAKDVAEAKQNAADFQTDAAIQKYQNVYGNVKGTVRDSLLDFFHGQGDAGTVAQRLGGTIVDAALSNTIDRLTNPLVQTMSQQILEIRGNTAALKAATDALEGGGGGAGGGGGKGSGAGGSKAAQARTLSDLQKGITAGLAAYSIASQSASQGVNAGNLLGGILSGASIGSTFGPAGGLIGGAVGGIADLIGGLFHHSNKPTATPQDLNPALYNAPAGFDLAAYRYSAFHTLPTMQNIGFNVKPQAVPIINLKVIVDGKETARSEAVQVVAEHTRSINVSLGNTWRDRYHPI